MRLQDGPEVQRMMGIKGNVKIILLVIEAIGLATGAYGFILGLSKMF